MQRSRSGWHTVSSDGPPRATTWHTNRGIATLLVLLMAWLCPRSSLTQETPPMVQSYEVETYDVESLLSAADSGGSVVLRAHGASHRLQLERSLVRSETYRAYAVHRGGSRRIFPPAAKTFKGSVEGETDSMVRLSFTANGLSGTLKTSGGWLYIQPLDAGAEGSTGDGSRAGSRVAVEHMVFSEKDIDPSFEARCRQVILPGTVHRASLPSAVAVVAATDGAPVLEMAVDVDFEFVQIYGDETSTEVESILNAVSGIYEAELGISVELSSLSLWEEEDDPYTETDSLGLLTEFRGHWNSNKSAIERDVAHLFTGRNLEDNTVGIAYVGVVCRKGDAYGLSQNLGTKALMPLLVAHEVGHNLNALHDDVNSSPRYIMYPTLGSTVLDQFSEQSKEAVSSYLSGASCVEAPEGEGGDDGGEGETEEVPAPSGGGGGGPVDPILLLLLLGWAAAGRLARKREH